MAASGKILIGAMGEILRTASGKIARSLTQDDADACVCCGGSACTEAVFAKACHLDVDENCDLVNSLGFWVCADNSCDGDSTPFSEYSPVIKAAGRCYAIQSGSLTDVGDLPPGTEVADAGGGWECVTGGCADEEACGAPLEVCQCICQSHDDDGHFCCWGKFDEDGNVPNFNWTYTAYQEGEITSTDMGGFNGLATCPERDCAANASCVWLRNDQRSKDGSGTKTGCCMEKMIEEKLSVKKMSGIFPCCESANTAPDTWGDRELVSQCGNLITPYLSESYTETLLPHSAGPGGCYSEQTRTVNITANCGSYESTIVTETWGYSSDGLNCVCQQYQKFTEYFKFTWSAPLTDSESALCEQCEQEIEAP